jgi:hypothetical protein
MPVGLSERADSAQWFCWLQKLYAEGNVLADEIIAYTRAAVQEPSITSMEIEEAVTLIKEAGPNAEYVTHEHTYTHFRDFWYPKLFYRDRFVPGPGGFGTDLNERLNERVRTILEQHQPEPLPREVDFEIERLEIVKSVASLEDEWHRPNRGVIVRHSETFSQTSKAWRIRFKWVYRPAAEAGDVSHRHRWLPKISPGAVGRARKPQV